VRPLWVKDGIVLRLEKYTEDWGDIDPEYAAFDASKRTVHPDITDLPDDQLAEILNKVNAELHPDERDEEAEG
jgi:hypothetical protein